VSRAGVLARGGGLEAADWLAPTARATLWGPLLVAGGCLLVSTATLRLLLGDPSLGPTGPSSTALGPTGLGPTGLGAAALAAALVAGLHDRAANLLEPMPVGLAVRRAQRLVLLAPAASVVWLACILLADVPRSGVLHTWGAFAALALSGLAVTAWSDTRHAVSLGVAVPLVWYAVTRVAPVLPEQLTDALAVWRDHPWIVTCVAAVALFSRRNR
jgi:hypothetical protein